MEHYMNFYGTLFIPKEKVKEFLELRLYSNFLKCCVYKVEIKKTKKFKYYNIRTFIEKTNEHYSSIIYASFIENVYGDLFLHRLDRTLGANMLYELMKLGFIYDNTDMKEFKERNGGG